MQSCGVRKLGLLLPKELKYVFSWKSVGGAESGMRQAQIWVVSGRTLGQYLD